MMINHLWTSIEQTHKLKVLEQEPMSRHTTYEIGGPADYFAEPSTVEALIDLLTVAKEKNMPYLVLGKGSNVLVADKGIRGLVISLGEHFGRFGFLGNFPGEDDYHWNLQHLHQRPVLNHRGKAYFYSEAGASMIDASRYASSQGLTGLEFATGIPGSVGGAIFMNAGAYEGSTVDVAKLSYYLDEDLKIKALEGTDQGFGYRMSAFQKGEKIILSTCYVLEEDDPQIIKDRVNDYTARREHSQPLDMPSCGSVFKRPEGHYVGKLITDAGLKGKAIGGAQVSLKHAGFIVNQGGATAQNVLDLIHFIQDEIYNRFGVHLETEVRRIGDY
jgi:UDP-N-acetylmuramate dehydrogenase